MHVQHSDYQLFTLSNVRGQRYSSTISLGGRLAHDTNMSEGLKRVSLVIFTLPFPAAALRTTGVKSHMVLNKSIIPPHSVSLMPQLL